MRNNHKYNVLSVSLNKIFPSFINPSILHCVQILFLTTLFYLLAFSGDQYKPLEWFGGMGPGSSQGGGRIGKAVEEAIS